MGYTVYINNDGDEEVCDTIGVVIVVLELILLADRDSE